MGHPVGPWQLQRGRVALVRSYDGVPVEIATVDVDSPASPITGPVYATAALLYDASGKVVAWVDDSGTNRVPVIGKILNPSGVPVGDVSNPLVVTDSAGAVSAALVTADFHRIVGVAAPGSQNYIAIDLDNDTGGGPGSGPYKHDGSGAGIQITWLSLSIEKDDIVDQWDVRFGVITRVDAASADIVWLQDGFLRLRDRLNHKQNHVVDRSAAVLDLTVVSNDLPDVAGSLITLGDTTVKTTDSFENVAGNSVNPAEGDIILRVDHVGGTGQLLVHYQFGYLAG